MSHSGLRLCFFLNSVQKCDIELRKASAALSTAETCSTFYYKAVGFCGLMKSKIRLGMNVKNVQKLNSRLQMMMMSFICSFRNNNNPKDIYPSFGYSPPRNKDAHVMMLPP